jgi:hypothetical protein
MLLVFIDIEGAEVAFHRLGIRMKTIFFFLKRGQKLCHDRLIKKEFTRMFTQRKPPVPKSYSPGIILPNFFAPASTQRRASALILSKITKEGDCLLRKTLALRMKTMIFVEIDEVNMRIPRGCWHQTQTVTLIEIADVGSLTNYRIIELLHLLVDMLNLTS